MRGSRDPPLDPHSWKQSGYLYAWVGWTFNPLEHRIDNEYVTKYLQYNELFVIGFVWWLWPLLTCAAVCKAFGFYNMVVYASTPMFASRSTRPGARTLGSLPPCPCSSF